MTQPPSDISAPSTSPAEPVSARSEVQENSAKDAPNRTSGATAVGNNAQQPGSLRSTPDIQASERPRATQTVAGHSVELMPTTVVGSYSVPEWLERLKTDFYQRRISGQYLDDIHEVVIKAALKDQELAGVDIVSDGELRRDNDVDYFLNRMPGVEIPHAAKTFYYDYYDAYVQHPIPLENDPSLNLVDDLKFTLAYTDRPVKFSITGPFSLARRVHNEAYTNSSDLVLAFAKVLNGEARALAAAGAAVIQIDEPFLAGYPDEIGLAVQAINIVFDGVSGPSRALHVCYGNRYARPVWEGHYEFLFPKILDADVDQLVLEFARKGYGDLDLFKKFPSSSLTLGLGVIDVKNPVPETPEAIAGRVRQALTVLPPERLMINPDCGLRHLPADVARDKLRAMSQGAALARADVLGTPHHEGDPS